MNANVVLDLNELAEYVASKALKIIEEKQRPVISNAQKFKEVFGEKTIDQLALCETRTVGPNVPKLFTKPSSWWDKPYEE